MKCFKILKRVRPRKVMPLPNFQDNWKTKYYEENVKDGVLALQQGKAVKIIDDGRGYELAYDIKRRFILEYQRQLSEQIKIDGGAEIIISFKY